MSFQKAKIEQRIPLWLIQASSGSGKTYSALCLMKGIVNGGKMAVIDTENRRSAIYANDFDFFIRDLAPNEQNINGYIAAMEEAKDKVDGLIVDGLSPAWKDLLDKSNKMEGNSFHNWGKLSPLQDKFLSYIQNYPKPLICTVRMKQGYAMEVNDKGKTVVKKVGLEPVQRNDLDYEFDISFTIDRDSHKASLGKCNYKQVEKYFEENGGEVLLTEEVGKILVKIIKGE